MKKKLLVALLTLSMVFCLMPTMAFAGEVEEPTEEPKVEAPVVEEPTVVEEANEEVTEAPKAEDQEQEQATMAAEEDQTAELEKKGEDPAGTWSGYKFTTSLENICGKIKNNKGEEVATVSLSNGVIDVTQAVNEVFKNGNICMVVIERAAKKSSLEAARSYSNAMFVKLDTTVTVDKAATKDTIFTYGIDSYLNRVSQIDLNNNYTIERSKDFSYNRSNYGKGGCELIENKIDLKKGETSATGALVLRADYTEAVPVEVSQKNTVGFVIGETGNDGNYTTSEALWAVIPIGVVKDISNNVYIKGFANSAELDAFIATTNAEIEKGDFDYIKWVEDKFTAKALEFSHTTIAKKTTKKGVNTGDSNELGLWLALGMMASVACAAYALKRKEN